ncbi:family 2 glycosyl transferase [Candidatus Magnetoovum chiemensis]|nr:family 2 glycosyl transferase [Candidatus Magnetoovum chiemensis]
MLRKNILKLLYNLFPFSLKADIDQNYIDYDIEISCVINFYSRIDLLTSILYCLSQQDISKDKFEVILVEDRDGSIEGKNAALRFSETLNIRYLTLNDNFGKMGFSRNHGILNAKGRNILFLDDDTIILQNNFLSALIEQFNKTDADCIIPHGSASFCLLNDKYDYHDPYFPSNRCTAYKRQALLELGGFVSNLIGQEEVEFLVRFTCANKVSVTSKNLEFMHPPFILHNLNKAKAVGKSFASLINRYPFIMWLMLLINGARYLPLLVFPFNRKGRTFGRFSLGFILGYLYYLANKEIEYS